MVLSFIKRMNLVLKGHPEIVIPHDQQDTSPSPTSSIEFIRKKPKTTTSKSMGKKKCKVSKVSSEADAVVEIANNHRCEDTTTTTTTSRANKHGYGEVTPDTDKYGYGEAVPDTDKYGYGEVVPDTDKYGYGDAETDSAARGGASSRRSTRTPRRSSMKTSESITQRRRESIGYSGEREVRLPGDRKVKRRTSITFNEQVNVRPIDPITEIATDIELLQLWFQDKEYTKIKQKMRKIVDRVETYGMEGYHQGGKVPCIRGLERMIGAYKYISWENKQQAWDAVLYEQQCQREGDGGPNTLLDAAANATASTADTKATATDEYVFDDVAISTPYREISEESKRIAIERAQQDQEDIREYTKSMRRACRRFSC